MPDIISKGYSIASQVYGGITTIDNFLGQFGPKQEMGRRKSIDGFVANQLHKDLARKAHFRVKIHPPNVLVEDGWDGHKVNDRISMMAESTTFPDMSTATSGETKIGTDNEYEIVTNLNYASFTMSFLCDTEMTQRKFFEKWINSTYIKDSLIVGGSPTYYNTYIGDVEIFQLIHNFPDDAGVGTDKDWTYMNRFLQVYPSSISAMDVSWDSADVQKLEVNFNFKSYEVLIPPQT